MNVLSILLFVILAVVLVILSVRYNVARLGRAKYAMQQCLKTQGYTVMSARLCWMPTGPYSWAIASHTPIYRVHALDRSGVVRQGWVRYVPFSDQAEVKWETET